MAAEEQSGGGQVDRMAESIRRNPLPYMLALALLFIVWQQHGLRGESERKDARYEKHVESDILRDSTTLKLARQLRARDERINDLQQQVIHLTNDTTK